MKLKALIVTVLIATGVLAAWKKEDYIRKPLDSVAKEVWIQNNTLDPTFITVSINTTVRWTNKDGVTHVVSSIGKLFNSGCLNSGNTYSYKFSTPGRYFYHCPIHLNMTGEVIVQ